MNGGTWLSCLRKSMYNAQLAGGKKRRESVLSERMVCSGCPVARRSREGSRPQASLWVKMWHFILFFDLWWERNVMEEERERNEGGGEDEAEKAKQRRWRRQCFPSARFVSFFHFFFHFGVGWKIFYSFSFTLVLAGKILSFHH